MTPRLVPAAVLACLALSVPVAGCGSDDERPTRAAWEQEWDDTRALIPDAAAFSDGSTDRCGELLGEVRARREELTPSPNEVIDDAFTDWVQQAEALGLDCPGEAEEVDERLRELDNLADLVDLALAGES